jgi:regulatory protein
MSTGRVRPLDQDADDGDQDADDGSGLARAYEIAYAFLNRRERTEHEVRAQLLRKGVSPVAAARVLSELIETRLVDDERFAQLFVADKRELEQWGRERILRGLAARGIDRAQGLAALAASDNDPAASEPESELDRALSLLRRRFPQPPVDRRERERALGVLLRKGYESELALDALTAYARGAD